MKLNKKTLVYSALAAIAAVIVYSCTCGDLQWTLSKAVASLTGKINVNLDCEEQPLEGAKVILSINGQDYETMTGADGTYRFDNLPDAQGTFPITVTSSDKNITEKKSEVSITPNTISTFNVTLSSKYGADANIIKTVENTTAITYTVTTDCDIAGDPAVIVFPPDVYPDDENDTIKIWSYQTDDHEFGNLLMEIKCRPGERDFQKIYVIKTIESQMQNDEGIVWYDLDGTVKIGLRTDKMPEKVIHNDEEVPLDEVYMKDGYAWISTSELGKTDFYFQVYRHVIKVEKIPIVFNPSIVYGPTDLLQVEYECYEGFELDLKGDSFDNIVLAASDFSKVKKVTRQLDIPYNIPSGEIVLLDAYQELIWYEYTDCDDQSYARLFGDIYYTIKDRQHTGGSN